MQRITPCLWFDKEAEDAARFYVSVFKNSKIRKIARYPDDAPGAAGSILTVSFELEGQDFLALNGGPDFKFTPAISLMVNCNSQEEIDELWRKLSADKDAEQCGWVKDKYGLSWQIVPASLGDMTADADPKKSARVVHAVLKMKKLDMKELQRAYEGR